MERPASADVAEAGRGGSQELTACSLWALAVGETLDAAFGFERVAGVGAVASLPERRSRREHRSDHEAEPDECAYHGGLGERGQAAASAMRHLMFSYIGMDSDVYRTIPIVFDRSASVYRTEVRIRLARAS